MRLFRWGRNLGLMLCCGIFPVVAVASEMSSGRFIVDAELPFRCAGPTEEKSVASTVALRDDDFVFLAADGGDALPRYEVNVYNFQNKTADVVIANLLKELQITVRAEIGSYPEMTGKNLHGELSSVMQQLTERTGLFYKYHADTKTLFLSRRTNMLVNIPHDKVVLLAVLDALRGAEIKRLDVDWEKYQIRVNVSMDELDKAKSLLAQILRDSYLLSAETKMYYVDTQKYPHYLPQALNEFGMQKIASFNAGVVGQSITLNKNVSVDSLIDKMREIAGMQLLARGLTVVPNGWNMRFNLGECSVSSLPYQNFSLLMRTRIQHQDEMHTQLTLMTENGELATFPLTTALNQEVILANIPAGQTGEFVFSVRLNLIRFVHKGSSIGNLVKGAVGTSKQTQVVGKTEERRN
ncbi:MAG: hypothetical protein J6Y85_02175 [Alphaproteobacteria bacterium]|nr:hypothetical protein [Alphaproteobacteria bacterium]